MTTTRRRARARTPARRTACAPGAPREQHGDPVEGHLDGEDGDEEPQEVSLRVVGVGQTDAISPRARGEQRRRAGRARAASSRASPRRSGRRPCAAPRATGRASSGTSAPRARRRQRPRRGRSAACWPRCRPRRCPSPNACACDEVPAEAEQAAQDRDDGDHRRRAAEPGEVRRAAGLTRPVRPGGSPGRRPSASSSRSTGCAR